MDQGALSPIGSVTSTTLLRGLLDPTNETVWRQYVERYRPLLVRYAVKFGASAEEAEDVAQSTLVTFSDAYRAGNYDRSRGRLSAWLFGIAKNEVRSFHRARRARLPQAPSEPVEPLVDDNLEEEWQREWRDAIVHECLRIVRREVQPETMRAFELFALADRRADDVAQELGMTPNAVFGAKRRVLNRIRELVPLVEDSW